MKSVAATVELRLLGSCPPQRKREERDRRKEIRFIASLPVTLLLCKHYLRKEDGINIVNEIKTSISFTTQKPVLYPDIPALLISSLGP